MSSNGVVARLLRLAIFFFDLLGSEKGFVHDFLDVGDVVILSYVDSAHGSRHEA